MKKLQRYMLIVCAILLLTGCDEIVSNFVSPDDLDVFTSKKQVKQEVIQVHHLEFSPDYKTFRITTRMYGDIGPYSLTDSNQVRTTVSCTNSGVNMSERTLPRLIGMRNIKSDNIAKEDIEVLALVDLTQPQEVLDRIKDNLMELRAVFNESNMYLAFIYGDSVGQTRPASQYVFDKYLISDRESYTLLYRSISQKYDEMLSHQGPWAKARHMALLIFSDNEVYDNDSDRPIDHDHYKFVEDLAQKSAHPDPNMIVCYAFNKPSGQETGEQDILMLKHLCEQTNGIFMQNYNGTDFKNCLLNAFNINPDANEFTFENPDGKVYCGNFERLTVNFYSVKADSLIASFHTTIHEGNYYNPIIVHGISIPAVIVFGTLMSILLFAAVWLLFQFIIPFISYKIFCHKHVIRYAGHNMGIGKNMVSESCYLCKEPFKTGDEVVVKCSHTMHKACWDENNYHCTEYSDHCKHGSHYYNSNNLLDSNNAPFYLKWILTAIVVTTLAWMLFISIHHSTSALIIRKLILWISGIEEGTPEATALLSGNAISPLPAFGFYMGLLLTLAISLLSSRLVNLRYNYWEFFLRSIISAIVCFLAFLAINVPVVVAHVQKIAFLVEWIPWVLSAFIITICGTYHTRVKMNKMMILASVVIPILSMYIWWAFYDNTIDYRIVSLIGFIFYGVGLMICIATAAPRSQRYFLHVEGAIKEMDIALFKWFRNAPERVVTIGKSLDCSLQLSWDISGTIAPVHAEISLRFGIPYLTALEEGIVINNRSLGVGEKVLLQHGTSFTIANTTFTYIEKDI